MPTVLILGAASDMAIAIARKFASEGFSIQLAARNANRLQALKADLSVRYQATCTLHEFDALDITKHQSFFSALQPVPDVTICVFGYLGENEHAMHDWNETARIIHTNYTGAVSILNIIGNQYAILKKGLIAGISSVAGERGRQSNYIYGSAKAGFTAYLAGMRNRLYREGVHVLTVKPGFVFTSMTEHLQLSPILTARTEEVAAAVYKGIITKKNTVYVKWFWRWIMLVIKCIPEFIFKKLKL